MPLEKLGKFREFFSFILLSPVLIFVCSVICCAVAAAYIIEVKLMMQMLIMPSLDFTILAADRCQTWITL